MSKICKKRVHGNDKKNSPSDSKKCSWSLHFTLHTAPSNNNIFQDVKKFGKKKNNILLKMVLFCDAVIQKVGNGL